MSNKPAKRDVEMTVHDPAALAHPIWGVPDLDPERVMEHAKKVSTVIDKLAAYALQLTEPRHWVSFKEKDGDGHPWLTGPGAEMMISKLSLRVDYVGDGYQVEEFEDEAGKVYVMTVKLRVSIGQWSSIACEGHCTTRDPFFSRGGKLKASKVDLGNIRQSAYTNALINGVCRLLGLRRMTWDKVREITNGKVTKDVVTKAEFKSGGKGGASRGRSDRVSTDEQRARVWAEWCKAYEVDPKSRGKEDGKAFWSWVDVVVGKGNRDQSKWNEKQIKDLLARAERDQAGDVAPPEASAAEGADPAGKEPAEAAAGDSAPDTAPSEAEEKPEEKKAE